VCVRTRNGLRPTCDDGATLAAGDSKMGPLSPIQKYSNSIQPQTIDSFFSHFSLGYGQHLCSMLRNILQAVARSSVVRVATQSRYGLNYRPVFGYRSVAVLKSVPPRRWAQSQAAPLPSTPHASPSTTPHVTLRPYQQECIEECLKYYFRGVRRQMVSLPVGKLNSHS
jgi:hypothetical protein